MVRPKLARSIQYFGDKVVDVLMYIIISSVIASIPYLVVPTLSPGFMFLTVAVAAGVGMILVYLLSPYVDRLVAKRRIDVEGKSSLSETPQKERAVSQLMTIAKMGYRHQLRERLGEIGQKLDDHVSLKFVWWSDMEPDLKKSLITHQPEYDALEDFSKSLNERNNNLRTSDFDMWNKLCKDHYERFKRLAFV